MRTDLHFHLLPGLDDGPRTSDESLELARLAAAEGTTTIVVTPHVRGDFVTDVSDLPELVRELEDRLHAEGLALSLRCGGELGHDMVGRLSQSDLEVVAIGPPGARWVLLETPLGGVDAAFHGACDELRDRGFAVVLGHPERSADLLSEGAWALRRELDLGTQVQVNALSLIGDHGPEARRTAERLLGLRFCDVIASDAHSTVRPPALGTGHAAALAAGLRPDEARRLVEANPAGLIARGATTPATPLPV